MMRRKLQRIEGCVQSYQSYDDAGTWCTSRVLTKVYDATNHMMAEVGGGASRTMKVCESILY